MPINMPHMGEAPANQGPGDEKPTVPSGALPEVAWLFILLVGGYLLLRRMVE